jgi:hypothetical protein
MNIEQAVFPRHDVDPRKKREDKWLLQAAKAIVSNFSKGMPMGSIFYSKATKYSEIADYAMNKQSIANYIKRQTGEDNPDTAFINIDQSTEAILKTHVQKILGRLKKIDYNIIATPIDSMSKTNLDLYYKNQMFKIMLRENLKKINPELADEDGIKKEHDEPDDLEELEMSMNFSPKFIRSDKAEKAINMLFNENDMPNQVDLIDENLVYYGVAILLEETDINNRVNITRIEPSKFICSKSDDGNFNEDEMSYAGHFSSVKLSALAQYFDSEQLEDIANLCKGKNGNNSFIYQSNDFSKGYDDFKAEVFSFQIRSYDTKVVEEKKDRRGNKKANYTDYSNIEKVGEKSTKANYVKDEYEVIYKGKWIVGTDFIYDYGLENNSKRSLNPKFIKKTSLGYHVIASSFHNMCAKGIVEDLIPIADELQTTILKLRNLSQRMIINGLAIDFTALENVALGGSGENPLTPQENLNMLWQIGVIGYRSEAISHDGKNQRKPIEALTIDYANQFASLWDNYQRNMNKMYEVSGLNQATDAATVNPKMLVGVANAQNAGTNNALYFIENARRKLLQRVGKHVVQRLQSAVVSGAYEGYVQTLGRSTIEYFKFEASELPFDYDIIFEDRPTEEQKQIFYQALQTEIQKGLLNAADVFTITNNHSLKDAQMVLAHRSKKAQEKASEEARAREESNGQIQTQSAATAEKSKQETLQMEYNLKMQLMDKEKEWDYKIKQLELGSTENIAEKNVHGKLADTILKNSEQSPNMGMEEKTELPIQQEQMPDQEAMPIG